MTEQRVVEGVNEIVFNMATVQKIVEYYLNKEMMQTDVVVVSCAFDTASTGPSMRVRFGPPEKK